VEQEERDTPSMMCVTLTWEDARSQSSLYFIDLRSMYKLLKDETLRTPIFTHPANKAIISSSYKTLDDSK